MRIVNIHEAKTHLSRLVDRAAKGESFVIANAGKPMAKVVPIDAATEGQVQRIGFMEGSIEVPDDFDQIAPRKSKGCSAAKDEAADRHAFAAVDGQAVCSPAAASTVPYDPQRPVRPNAGGAEPC